MLQTQIPSPLKSWKVEFSTDPTCGLARRAQHLDDQLSRLLDPLDTRSETRAARIERLRERMADETKVTETAVLLWREAERLRWEMALSALDLARREARRTQIPELTCEDMVGEAALGLYEAAKRFDPDRGFKFSTYARWWIRARTKEARAASHRIVRLPDSARRQRTRLLRSESGLKAHGNGRPSVAEIADASNVASRRAADLLSTFSSVSWEHVAIDGGHSLEETTSDPEARCMDQEIGDRQDEAIMMEGLLASIEGVHQRIVVARFGLDGGTPQTLGDLSSALGVTRERIRQLEREALDVLKERIESAHAPRISAAAMKRTLQPSLRSGGRPAADPVPGN